MTAQINACPIASKNIKMAHQNSAPQLLFFIISFGTEIVPPLRLLLFAPYHRAKMVYLALILA